MRSPCGIMANMIDYNTVLIKFKSSDAISFIFLRITFGNGINTLIPQVMSSIVPLLFFYKNGFGIK